MQYYLIPTILKRMQRLLYSRCFLLTTRSCPDYDFARDHGLAVSHFPLKIISTSQSSARTINISRRQTGVVWLTATLYAGTAIVHSFALTCPGL